MSAQYIEVRLLTNEGGPKECLIRVADIVWANPNKEGGSWIKLDDCSTEFRVTDDYREIKHLILNATNT